MTVHETMRRNVRGVMGLRVRACSVVRTAAVAARRTVVRGALPVVLFALATEAGAQERQRQGGRPPAAQRAQMERRVQQRVDSLIRARLTLTDEQLTQLRDVASRTESARRDVRRDELSTRAALRRELLAGDAANEARVAELLEQVPRIERRRIELLETEQRELARFLSPVQRGRYFALQDELRHMMQDMQRRRMGDSASVRGGRTIRPPAPR